MKRFPILLTAIIALILFSCTPHYVASNFDSKTHDHQTVAILPFEMIYTGNMPEWLTETDLWEIQTAESKAFQLSFYNEILRSTKFGKDPISVGFQDYRKTLNLLEQNSVDIPESWSAEPEYLADILGVDAIVRARVVKKRFMPDLASYGISVSLHIVNILTDHVVWPWLPPGITTAKRIDASYSLIDGADAEVLWNVAIQRDADWTRPANDIIDDLNRQGAKTFPYRLGRLFPI